VSEGRSRLPVVYGDGHGQQVQGRGLTISAEEVKRYADGKICGNCHYFSPEHGVGEMVRTQFMPKLVQELEWKPEHLGAAITSEGGLCTDRGDMLTATFTVACENWRESRGKLRRAPSSDQLEKLGNQKRTMQRLNKERMDKQRNEMLRKMNGQR
jgi:hypothetical protein